MMNKISYQNNHQISRLNKVFLDIKKKIVDQETNITEDEYQYLKNISHNKLLVFLYNLILKASTYSEEAIEIIGEIIESLRDDDIEKDILESIDLYQNYFIFNQSDPQNEIPASEKKKNIYQYSIEITNF